MGHLSEGSARLTINCIPVYDVNTLLDRARDFGDVCILRLPSSSPERYRYRIRGVAQLVNSVAAMLGPRATLITLGEVVDLVEIHAALASSMRYQHWIALKRALPRFTRDLNTLPQYHYGALIHTRYKSSLRHAKTRIEYTYCPVCDKTTKDYGGKKHTYHEYGTLLSDVWRDIACDLDGDLDPVFTRFADLFGIEPYRELRVLDCRPLALERTLVEPLSLKSSESHASGENLVNKLLVGDCIEQLRTISNDSVDFVFADPPYNLGKRYIGYADDLAITEYFEWCDKWIDELARVLRPGRTCAILNIPIGAIRHFLYMERILSFQSWIVWEALSFPVRLIMPSHYTMLCFSKGNPRKLPGLDVTAGAPTLFGALNSYRPLEPLTEGFCLRTKCITKRRSMRINDSGPLTDLWWDIHRLKHNTRRVDHPCQLPPQLMYRLISLFTQPGEIVLDCFNGTGTTTLTAYQLGRRYIGIEISDKYHSIALERHKEIDQGLNPFRKADRMLTAKNSRVPRMPKRRYEVPKKVLQLEVKRIAKELGRLPTREDVMKCSKYPIKYYDESFFSWGEVCAAARTTGMSENRLTRQDKPVQLVLLEKKRRYRVRQ